MIQPKIVDQSAKCETAIMTSCHLWLCVADVLFGRGYDEMPIRPAAGFLTTGMKWRGGMAILHDAQIECEQFEGSRRCIAQRWREMEPF